MVVEPKVEGIRQSMANVLMNKSPDTTLRTTPAAPAVVTPQRSSTIVTAPSTDGKPAQAAPVSGQPVVAKPGESANPPQPSQEQIAAAAKKAEDDLKTA